MGINVYTVHVKPEAALTEDGAVQVVREGFSFWAFLFGFLWALYHRLWLVAALYLGLTVALGLFFSGAADILQVVVAFLFGCEAQNFRRDALEKKGYEEQDVIVAYDPLEAELRFLQSRG